VPKKARVLTKEQVEKFLVEAPDDYWLQEPELYTGHSFRRSAATMVLDAGGDILTLKRAGGWKSSGIAEGYVDDSINKKIEIAK
jgi:integrase